MKRDIRLPENPDKERAGPAEAKERATRATCAVVSDGIRRKYDSILLNNVSSAIN